MDARAALLDQSYYQLLRLVNNLTAAGLLDREEPYPMLDRDLAETARDVCGKVRDLAEMLGIRLEFRNARDQQICAFCRPAIEQLLYQLEVLSLEPYFQRFRQITAGFLQGTVSRIS